MFIIVVLLGKLSVFVNIIVNTFHLQVVLKDNDQGASEVVQKGNDANWLHAISRVKSRWSRRARGKIKVEKFENTYTKFEQTFYTLAKLVLLLLLRQFEINFGER